MNSEAKESWMPLEVIPDDICDVIFSDIGNGACGFNSYCSSKDGTPNCDCTP
ncbi:hypothetical protein Pint_15800 [Pistacia integerrima]|uniref:Uncharacterized protein n=1 Tax=Pistacia integerrima TaxID=434235 RepID=A0ACC0ZCR0_9ROSI|nr:hypothetical protein Pint_15800 [Pistacia integerrima]